MAEIINNYRYECMKHLDRVTLANSGAYFEETTSHILTCYTMKLVQWLQYVSVMVHTVGVWFKAWLQWLLVFLLGTWKWCRKLCKVGLSLTGKHTLNCNIFVLAHLVFTLKKSFIYDMSKACFRFQLIFMFACLALTLNSRQAIICASFITISAQ